MRRFTGLFALGATLLTLASAQAQQTYTQNLDFQTSNQSMWNLAIGQAGFAYDFGLTQSWDTHGDVSVEKHRHDRVLGTFGFDLTANTTGQAGLNLHAYATSGSVAVDYPMQLIIDYPNDLRLLPGATFPVHTRFVATSNGSLNTLSPDAGVGVSAILQADPMKIHVRAEAFSRNYINSDVVNNPVNINFKLFDSHDLTQGSFDVQNLGIVTGDYHPPVVSTSVVSDGHTILHSRGQDTFLTITGDFSNLLARALDLPPFAKDYQKGFVAGHVDVGYHFLDLFGQVPISLLQDFEFTPHPKVTLNLSTGQSVTFYAGDTIDLTMPADGSPLTVTPSVALENQFTNKTSVVVEAGLQFIPAEVHVSGKIASQSLGSLSYQPFPTINIIDDILASIPVYNQTFALSGFTPQTLPAFTIARPIPALVARDVTYNAIHEGNYYTLHVDAPGVLAGDIGSAGFTAIPQHQYHTNPLNYFALNADGSLDYTREGGPGHDDFRYRITDGAGQISEATIHIIRQ